MEKQAKISPDRQHVIPPYAIRFYGLLICFIASGIGTLLGVELHARRVAEPWLICIVSGIGMIVYSKSYVLYKTGFTERILWIPYRHNSWEFVGEVLVFEKSTTGVRSFGECVFVITSSGCKPFDPEKETIDAYIKRYKDFVTTIVVSKRKKADYIAAFEETIGSVSVFD